jgi:transcription elongation factor GreA
MRLTQSVGGKILADKKIVLTYEGLRDLENELQELKTIRRKEVAEKIKEARGQGDLSENAEYDAAKEEQAEIEVRIVQLEKLLKNAEVIDEDGIDTNVVSLGCKVNLLDMEYDEELRFSIVGTTEASPTVGKISNESPLGQALLGKVVNDIVEVAAPDGIIKYKILQIE